MNAPKPDKAHALLFKLETDLHTVRHFSMALMLMSNRSDESDELGTVNALAAEIHCAAKRLLQRVEDGIAAGREARP